MTVRSLCASWRRTRCSWCRWTSMATGSAIITCSPTCCGPVPPHRRWSGRHPASAGLSLVQSPGLLDEAVEQALRAGHLDVAANLVQNLSEEQLLAEQNVGMLLRWKMDLPDSLLISTPRLIVLYSWALGLACQLGRRRRAGQSPEPLPAGAVGDARKSMLAQWLALSGTHRPRRVATASAPCPICGEALRACRASVTASAWCVSSICPTWPLPMATCGARETGTATLELAQRVRQPVVRSLRPL